ncbi:MAG: sugar transferase [Rhodospirillales bacterium]
MVQYLSFIEHEVRRVDVRRIDLGWLLYSDGFYFGTIDNALKRALDVLVSLMLLVLFSPFLVFGAIAIRLDDGGPVLYSQQRVTRNGRPFRIYKLRTMRVNAEAAGEVWAAVRDPRVTRIGNLLRQSGSTKCHNSGTCCAATCRWWDRGRKGPSSSRSWVGRCHCTMSGTW